MSGDESGSQGGCSEDQLREEPEDCVVSSPGSAASGT